MIKTRTWEGKHDVLVAGRLNMLITLKKNLICHLMLVVFNLYIKNISWVVGNHYFSSSNVSLRPAWSRDFVTEQPGLYCKTLSKNNKRKKRRERE